VRVSRPGILAEATLLATTELLLEVVAARAGLRFYKSAQRLALVAVSPSGDITGYRQVEEEEEIAGDHQGVQALGLTSPRKAAMVTAPRLAAWGLSLLVVIQVARAHSLAFIVVNSPKLANAKAPLLIAGVDTNVLPAMNAESLETV
jgi:hypothetical protein